MILEENMNFYVEPAFEKICFWFYQKANNIPNFETNVYIIIVYK